MFPSVNKSLHVAPPVVDIRACFTFCAPDLISGGLNNHNINNNNHNNVNNNNHNHNVLFLVAQLHYYIITLLLLPPLQAHSYKHPCQLLVPVM